MTPDLHGLTKLSPAWWGAIAGAVMAGATLAPEQRFIAGAAAGGAMAWLALKLAGPCCAGCAGASSGTSATASASSAASSSEPGGGELGNVYEPTDGGELFAQTPVPSAWGDTLASSAPSASSGTCTDCNQVAAFQYEANPTLNPALAGPKMMVLS